MDARIDDVNVFLLSKEIEIKEREANLLKIILRCRKLGIDIDADFLQSSEEETQDNLKVKHKVVPLQVCKVQEIFPSSVDQGSAEQSDDLVEPRLEDFGLSEESLKAIVQLPICTIRNFKSTTSFKPKQYRQENAETIDRSPTLSLRTVPFHESTSSDPKFDCTPEVCQMGKTCFFKAHVQDQTGNKGTRDFVSPALTPKLNVRALKGSKLTDSFGKMCVTKRHSLVSPEEPEQTSTMDKFKTFVINENNNAFLANFSASTLSTRTPEEPELTVSIKNDDLSFSDLQMPESPQLLQYWQKDSNSGLRQFRY